MPDLAVVVTTYMPPGGVGANRMVATARALASWRDNAGMERYPLVIADDGSDPRWIDTLCNRFVDCHRVRTNRVGCGGALAAGVRHAITEGATTIFYAQDDWELVEPLDLAPSLALLDDFADVVRLGPTHPNLSAHVVRTDTPGAEWCLEYDWEGGGYVVGWRPAIYHASILQEEDIAGLEGLSAIEAERIWATRYATRRIPPRVFHAANCTLAGPFRHIDTVELGEDDPATLTARYATTGAEQIR